ncbi:MAG: PIG-L family deacetylase [Planctomycetota bacterium]|nr:PIG-L family deacetylase [Planctomycetota bacterium]
MAPHPDDEVLGCGGLIARTVAAGGDVAVVVLSRGERSHASCCDLSGEAIGQRRVALAAEAAGRLSLPQERLIFLDWPDGQIAGNGPKEQDRRVDELAGWIVRLRPEAVFAPHPFEGWVDHEAAERLTRTAIEGSGVSCRLFHYCVWFWFSMPLRRALQIDWRRARLLDIADVYDRKRAAMDAYLEPCAPCGNPWSGVLPPELLRTFRCRKELFFEAAGTGGSQLAGGVEIEESVATS